MATLSYNETTQRQLKVRHIFFPGAYSFICEIVIGVVALLAFNVSELSNQLLTKKFNNADPLPVGIKYCKISLMACKASTWYSKYYFLYSGL